MIPSLTLLLAIVLGIPFAALADLRPLSRSMLSNLQATNAIGESLSIDDYPGVEIAARELRDRAREIQGWDVSKLGFKPSDKNEFDAYLQLQEEISAKIISAATKQDAPSVVTGLGEMLEKSCLACHKAFRDRQGRLKSSTLFMTSFVSAWREINRGLLLNDFSVAARGARTLAAVGQIMSWDPIVRSSFDIAEPAQRNKFRAHANNLITAADNIEDAAARGETEEIEQGLTKMWNLGCLACHKDFR
jgi:cytochrome c556